MSPGQDARVQAMIDMTDRILIRIKHMKLTDRERLRLIEYLAGYDPTAVAEGLRFIEYTRSQDAPAPRAAGILDAPPTPPAGIVQHGQPAACPDHGGARGVNQLGCTWCSEERAAFYQSVAAGG